MPEFDQMYHKGAFAEDALIHFSSYLFKYQGQAIFAAV